MQRASADRADSPQMVQVVMGNICAFTPPARPATVSPASKPYKALAPCMESTCYSTAHEEINLISDFLFFSLTCWALINHL